jgi:ribosomal protein S18 acetylase RimI-like enzyme
MGWRVRPAIPADGERIAELRVASWRHAYRDILPAEGLAGMRPEAGYAYWAAQAEAPPPTGLFVTVGDDDRAVAFCVVGAVREERDRHPEQATGELMAIYADPAALGTGAGGAVHTAALEHLARHGFRHVVLWVLEDNEIGIGFYRAQGWQPDDARITFDWAGSSAAEVRYSKSLEPVAPSSV